MIASRQVMGFCKLINLLLQEGKNSQDKYENLSNKCNFY